MIIRNVSYQPWVGKLCAKHWLCFGAGLLAVEIAPEGILGSDPCVRISDHMFVCWNILSLMILIIRNCWLSTLVLVRQAVCDLIMGKDGRPDPWMMDQGV